jgi:hypothetical protein
MALIRRTVTERMRYANRANARLSTGPRTRAGKARSRLNGLRHGLRSRRLTRYFRLWLESQLAAPGEPRPPWDVSEMPVPFFRHPGYSRWRVRQVREFLHAVSKYLPAPEPRCHRKEFYFDHRTRQVIENTGDLAGNGTKRT